MRSTDEQLRQTADGRGQCPAPTKGTPAEAHDRGWLASLSMDELLEQMETAQACAHASELPHEKQRQTARAEVFEDELRLRLRALHSDDLELLMTNAQHEAMKAPNDPAALPYFARAELYRSEAEDRLLRQAYRAPLAPLPPQRAESREERAESMAEQLTK